MSRSYRVAVKELDQVGGARRMMSQFCLEMGGDETFRGRVSLVATELGRNLVIHAKGGELIYRELKDDRSRGIEILAVDRGPGMRNPGECLRDGYSTAGTPGTGLGAVRRLADLFDLSTLEGRGTAICARLYIGNAQPEPRSWAIGVINIPIEGENVCGDAWSIHYEPNEIRLLVADGLGHGPFAAEASQEAVAVHQANTRLPMEEVIKIMHRALIKTRGAAAAMVQVSTTSNQVSMIGVGNIVVRIFDGQGGSRQLASSSGTLGANLHRAQSYKSAWSATSLLVVHSDGLSGSWDPKTYPGLMQRHPATIAAVLYRDFSRGRDDATVVALSSAR